MSRTKSTIQQTPPSLAGKPKVSLDKSDFEAIIQQDGYRVYHESSYECPCKDDQNGNHPLSSCKNCGGSGYVFVNRTQTRMVLTSINVSTKFKEWSAENAGTVAVTARDVDRLSFMDRITLLDGISEYSEALHPTIIDVNGIDKLTAFTVYDILSIDGIFLFEGGDKKLKLLENITDYTFEHNKIILNETYNTLINPTIAIRYQHNPQFYVLDLPRDTINFPVKNRKTGKLEELAFPIHAIARRTHYVLDEENFEGNRVFDNSFADTCDNEIFTKFEKTIKNSEITTLFNTLTDKQQEELFKLLFADDQLFAVTAQNEVYVG